MEKVALALVNVAQHFRQYFPSLKINIQTDCPIAKVLCKLELDRKMMACSIELSKYEIHYKPIGTIWAQSLADFINEFHPL